MPLPIIPKPEFPNVPSLPGVPQIMRASLFSPATEIVLGVAALQSQLWSSISSPHQWGIFDVNNNQVIIPDSILSLDNRNEWRLQDFPVQDGAFASYNKVIIPYETSVRMSKAGSVTDRRDFINQIADIAGDLNLYQILTPEVSYINVNITRYEVTRRGAEGAYFLTEVDVFLRQILQVQAQYSTVDINTVNAQQPSAIPSTNFGNQQPQGVSSGVNSLALNAIAGQPN